MRNRTGNNGSYSGTGKKRGKGGERDMGRRGDGVNEKRNAWEKGKRF